MYFNEYEFKKALKMADIDIVKSTSMYEEYLRKYSKDYSTYPYYASNLITLGRLKEAEEVLEYVEEIRRRDNKFSKITKTFELYKKSFAFTKARLLAYQEKYEELFNYYLENKSVFKDNAILFFTKKKLGMLDLGKRDTNSYLYRQIVDYNEEDFLLHIRKHLIDYKDSSCAFNLDFPLEEVITEVKKHIPSDKRLFSGFFENTYYFKFDSCGKDDNKSVNYFKVICFNDTGDIITMYPCGEGEYLPFVDLNYMRDKDTSKVLKIGQIDKFNRRYGFKK